MMSEVASVQSTSVPHTPQHATFGENTDKTATTTVRRPRNREVTSRYKSSTPQVSLSRRFTNSNGDRLPNALDLPSPKWSQSLDKRNPSPARSKETKVSGDILSNNDVCVPPKRASARTELLWPPSTKSLSTSMQCESYLQPLNALHKKSVNGGKDNNSMADHTLRPTPNTGQRRLPEPKNTSSQFQNSDQAENAQPLENAFKSEHSCWPGSNAKMYGTALSKSVDLSVDRGRPHPKATTLLVQQPKPTYGSSRAPRPLSSSRVLSQSTNEGQAFGSESHKAKLESRGRKDAPSVAISSKSSTRDSLEKPHVDEVPRETQMAVSSTCFDTYSITDDTLDMESVSSSICTVGDALVSSRSTTSNTTEQRGVRGTNVPARFWQDAANRSVRSSHKSNVRSSMLEFDLAAATLRKTGIRHVTPMSPEPLAEPSSFFNEAPSPPWAALQNQSLSAFISAQQSSNVTRTASYTRTPSPGRPRVPLPSLLQEGHKPSSATVMLTFGVDTLKRGKKVLTQIDESHLQRTLHNRLLQWRFVNARAKATMDAQTAGAQKALYNVCVKTFELRASTTTKRIQLDQARHIHKLNALVSAQAPALEAWSALQQEHHLALKGTIQALESAIVRVPVTGGVKADAPAVKEAMGSAFNVMNSVENAVNYLAPKAEDTYLLVSELARVVAQERILLEECADLVAMASALQMEECSLRAHMIQLESERDQAVTNILVDSH